MYIYIFMYVFYMYKCIYIYVITTERFLEVATESWPE